MQGVQARVGKLGAREKDSQIMIEIRITSFFKTSDAEVNYRKAYI